MNSFRLDIKGPLVLLFLQKGSSGLVPMTPQGIVPLSLNQMGDFTYKQPSGEEVSKLYTILDIDNSREEIEEFQSFVRQAPISVPTDYAPLKYSTAANYSVMDKIIIFGSIIILLTSILGLLLLTVSKYKAGVRNII